MISDSITQAYSQTGGDLPYFVGKQYGSGWLRTLARVAFPIIKRVVSVAGRTANDVINSNKNYPPTLVARLHSNPSIRRVIYNRTMFQSPSERTCGLYCIQFLRNISEATINSY